MTDAIYYIQLGMNYLRPVLEVLILTTLLYSGLYYLRGTRGANILAGLLIILLLLTVTSDLIKFEVISWLLNFLWTSLVIAFIVIFQPELRRGFAQLGTTPFQHRSKKQEAISEVVAAVLNMAKRRIGVIIVFERQIGMRSIVEDAVKLDAKINSHLLESLFFPNSPLHDGAVIIKNDTIIAAHAILPLSKEEALLRSLGTRHRAAVGITEETDAVALVVSEETGIISLACRGNIRRNIKADKLRRYLNGLLLSSSDSSFNSVFTMDESSGFGDDKEIK
jgi:diadenylate cyclase